MKALYLFIFACFMILPAQAQWIEIGDRIERYVVVGDTIVGVRNGNKITVTTDRGQTWSELIAMPWNEDGAAHYVHTPFYANGHFYAYARNSQTGFFRTTDSIENWERIEEGLPLVAPNSRKQDILRAFAFDGKLYGYTGAAAGENRRTIMSDNNGDSWTVQAENLPDYTDFKTNGQVILAGNTDGIFQSTDGAKTFTKVGSHSFPSTMRAFDAEGTTIVAVYQGGAGYLLDYTLDFGETWNTLDVHALYEHFLTNIEIQDGKVFGQSMTQGVIIDLEGGTYTTLGAPTYLWLGAAEKPMFPYDYQVVGDTLYAIGQDGTTTKLFKRPLSDFATSTESLNQLTSFKLEQNYPNPFNPATSIGFSLEQANQVELNIYNILGQKIETLLKAQYAAGRHEVAFNAANYVSGVYIYELKTGNYSKFKKMTLVK